MTEQLKQTQAPFEIPEGGSPVTQSYLHELSAPGEDSEKGAQREKTEEAEETFLALESLYSAPEGEKEEDKNMRWQRRNELRDQITEMITTDYDVASYLAGIAARERMLRGTNNGLSAEESLYPGLNQPTHIEELVDSAFGDTYGWGDQLSQIRDQAVEDFRAWQKEQFPASNHDYTVEPEDGIFSHTMESTAQPHDVLQHLLDRTAAWEKASGVNLSMEVSEFGYPVLDLATEDPDVALEVLQTITQNEPLVYHGMHYNEFMRQAGMEPVELYPNLDPKLSRQEGRKAVYATDRLEGGLVHAVLEHRLTDANPYGGQTYALKPWLGDKAIEVSPQLSDALERGENTFTEGWLYVLPASEFKSSHFHHSNHEFVQTERPVTPLMVVKVGADLGPKLVNEHTIEVQQ